MTTVNKYNFSCIILAAGKGTRMRGSLPKVLHKIAAKPLVAHVLSSVSPLKPHQVVTVIARGMENVQVACRREFPACEFAVQEEQKGTGDAVRSAISTLNVKSDFVLVLYGDTPLMRTQTLAALLEKSTVCDIAVLGMKMADPSGYGRLVVDEKSKLEAIVECKDASSAEKKIMLCNSGVMAIRRKYLPDLLAKLSTNNASKEYYLTDIIALANKSSLRCMVVEADDASELAGINTRAQLAAAEASLQARLRNIAMENGATLVDPSTVYFAADTKLGADVVVHPFVVFGSGVSVADGTEIRSYSHIEGATIGEGAVIGPFARLRPGTVIEEEGHVGNFVELKATKLGRGAKANHLSYIGDAEVGAGANIGAGTITCNYDGVNKYKTTIGDGAFIGSNSSLVAPVSIGAGAMVGAGSVITDDVADNALAISRAAQILKPGKASELKKRPKNK
jgi:bifunctional UDP-N-acetylglucosamine pyrophosphorylase/glucosamine-1-phosphate N-acetyltransferase